MADVDEVVAGVATMAEVAVTVKAPKAVAAVGIEANLEEAEDDEGLAMIAAEVLAKVVIEAHLVSRPGTFEPFLPDGY